MLRRGLIISRRGRVGIAWHCVAPPSHWAFCRAPSQYGPTACAAGSGARSRRRRVMDTRPGWLHTRVGAGLRHRHPPHAHQVGLARPGPPAKLHCAAPRACFLSSKKFNWGGPLCQNKAAPTIQPSAQQGAAGGHKHGFTPYHDDSVNPTGAAGMEAAAEVSDNRVARQFHCGSVGDALAPQGRARKTARTFQLLGRGGTRAAWLHRGAIARAASRVCAPVAQRALHARAAPLPCTTQRSRVSPIVWLRAPTAGHGVSGPDDGHGGQAWPGCGLGAAADGKQPRQCLKPCRAAASRTRCSQQADGRCLAESLLRSWRWRRSRAPQQSRSACCLQRAAAPAGLGPLRRLGPAGVTCGA